MSHSDRARRLSSLPKGYHARVVRVATDNPERAERLSALGVTPGAPVSVLQTFPAFVFLCDQTELAVEPSVARCVFVEEDEPVPAGLERS